MLINNKSLTKIIKRVDLTTEQEANLNEISNIKNNIDNKVDKITGKQLSTEDYTSQEKTDLANLKTIIGDTNSGLIKDVKDLKTNGVSQDNINSAIENYLTEHPVQSGATTEQAAQIEANRTAIGDSNSGLIKEVNNIKNTELQNLNTAIQTLETLVGLDETLGDKSGLPTGDANVIASINRIDAKPTGGNGLTSEQEAKLNSIDNKVDKIDGKGLSTEDYTTEEKTTLANLKTTIGDTSSGLVKDVEDLKTNGVSQDNINSAVEKYLQDNPVQSGATTEQVAQIEANKIAISNIAPLDISCINTTESIQGEVDETIVKQEYLGGYIEIQPDSWDGEVCATDSTTKTWGFPFSLLPVERKKIKDLVFNGSGTNLMYIRFPLGFAYRGYRNIDETTNLAKNIGERFKGQNATLKEWLKDISKSGGGLAPEYWCPPVYWLTSGSYSGVNRLRAGGSYSMTTTLASIKDSDTVQYNAQIEAFTDAVLDDLEYLHQNIAPVRMFALQNEPRYEQQPYGSCAYDAQTYNDVLEVLYPKIQSSPILSYYEDEPNEVKLLVSSSDEHDPFTGIAKTFIDNHSDMIWGYAYHAMYKLSGENNNSGADWLKSSEFATIKGNKENVFTNEYEYFSADKSDEFRCSNNMLRLINELAYSESKILMPIIHICKPLGQTLTGTNTNGYCLFPTNLKDEYGVNITATTNVEKLPKGTFSYNKWAYNSWALIGENIPINSYVVGRYNTNITGISYVVLKNLNKLYILMVNQKDKNVTIKLTFNEEKEFKGKLYNLNYCGEELKSIKGKEINFIIPKYSGIFWKEVSKKPSLIEEIPCTNISLSSNSLTFNDLNAQTITATVTPNNTTDIIIWNVDDPNIATVDKGIITPVSNGSTNIIVTCGNQSAVCSVTVSLPSLQTISAVYTQGSTKIYPNTTLNNLKNNLVITGNYSDGSTKEIIDYELSGVLTEGTSVITVTYNGKTTTFNVTVSPQAILQSITATYNQGSTIIYNTNTLDSLKNNLVVIANYSDGGTLTVSDYELSGALEVGTSTVTVTYQDKTTTFNVTVIEAPKGNELITDALLVNFIAKNGCVGVHESGSEVGKTYLLDATSGRRYTDDSLSSSIYNDGDKYITLSNSNALSFGDTSKVTIGESYSLELCILTSSIVKSSTTFIGSNAYISDNKGGTIFICRSGNIIEASYRPTVNSTTPLQYVFNTTDEFIHLVAVVDKDNNKFNYYVNGVLNSSVDITVYATESNALTLNKNVNSIFNTSCSYNAIRVYDKALSAIEVKSNYEYQKAYM